MKLQITPQRLSGSITPPPSKSQAHRALIAAYLAGSVEQISNLTNSQDIVATKACMETLCGASADESAPDLRKVSPPDTARHKEGPLPALDCGESGSTLRFLIPVALVLRGGGVFTGRGRLMERPQEPYFNLFKEKGVCYEQKDGNLTISGRLTPGDYPLPGNVSSQFITGLLYALPLLAGTSRLLLTTALESAGYVDMTLEILQQFGITVLYDGKREFFIPGAQTYRPHACAVEADWSQAGFWYAARGIGHPVAVVGMNHQSTQGDRVLAAWAEQLSQPGEVVLDLSGAPDLAPPLAAWAALRAGQVTRFIHAERLRIKECDRLEAISTQLGRLGAHLEEGPDSLSIFGVSALHGGEVESQNDHRIAMMLAIAATRADGPVLLRDAEVVAKSYPNFWEDYAALGGQFEVIV